MLRRLLLTLSVALSLLGLYGVYAVVTKPVLTLPTLSVAVPVGPINAPPRPVENVRIAETHLPQQEWAANAKYHLKTNQAYIYSNRWEPDGTAGRIRFRPFAMVWISKNKETGVEEAVTVVSESASVKFAGSFEMPTPQPGRLIHASLDGRAQVNGPNGLVIDGRHLYFSESAGQMWSDNEVRFEYAGNRGRADILQMDLIPQEGEPGKDRPHIFGVRNVRLSRNVKMELQLQEKDRPLPLTITCDGSFDFDVVEQRATYSENVVAFRQTAPAEVDWIECDRLTVQFGAADTAASTRVLPEPGISGQYQELNPRMKFRWLQADAAPAANDAAPSLVKLLSTKYQLEARAASVLYDGDHRQVRLTHPDGVQVLRSRYPILQCPDVTFTLGEGEQLKSAVCRGPGWLVHRDSKSNAVLFTADWKAQLQHAQDPGTGLDLIELQDKGSFRQPNEGTALGAELIRVWMRPPTPKPDDTPATDAELLPAFNRVELDRLEAHRSVVLVSPQLEANGEVLEVWLDRNATPVAQPLSRPETRPGKSEGGTPGGKEQATASKLETMKATAQKIRARLRPQPGGQPDLAELWTEGRVVLEQVTQPDQPRRRVEADRVHLENHGGMHQILNMVGSPAHVQDGEVHLEGWEMHLHRADNQFEVVGRGALRLPVDSDLEGTPLAQPSQLKLSWQERMKFDGLLATFRGRTQAVLDDRTLSCETMEVTLSQRVRFDEANQRTTKIDLQSIVCRDHVELNTQLYENSKLIEIQTARAWELRLDRATGEMFGQGPGLMETWRRGSNPRSGLVPQQTATANSPIQLDTSEWLFTQVKFDGEMTGHMQDRHAVFKKRVEILHGPVKLPNQRLTRDKLPKAGGFMSCDELQVKQLPKTRDRGAMIQLAGEGNAWLEGDGFAASADVIVYDQVRESYLLRGKGKNNARIWNNVVPGVEPELNAFQRGEFIPATRQIRVDAVSGASGSQ